VKFVLSNTIKEFVKMTDF
jgi:hypothetical protein